VSGNQLETCQVLVDASTDDILIDNTELLLDFHGTLSAWKYIQRQLYPPFQNLSAESRLRVATTYTKRDLLFTSHNQAALVETMLTTGETIDPDVFMLVSEGGHEIFQSLVEKWAAEFRKNSMTSDIGAKLDETLEPCILEKLKISKPNSWGLIGYEHLLSKLITMGVSIQRIDNEGRTLLFHLIDGFCFKSNFLNRIWELQRWMEYLVAMLARWVKMLLKCGIDLEDYGRWEQLNMQNDDKDLTFEWREYVIEKEQYVSHSFDFRLINFSYGPQPEDWKFWFSELTDPFAGEFWAIVEERRPWDADEDMDEDSDDEEFDTQEEAIPGAWKEDF
jgi:hypothetical protein